MGNTYTPDWLSNKVDQEELEYTPDWLSKEKAKKKSPAELLAAQRAKEEYNKSIDEYLAKPNENPFVSAIKETGKDFARVPGTVGRAMANAGVEIADQINQIAALDPTGRLNPYGQEGQRAISKELGQAKAGLQQIEEEEGVQNDLLSGISRSVGGAAVSIPVKYANPVGLGVMAIEGTLGGMTKGQTADDVAQRIMDDLGADVPADERSALEKLKDTWQGAKKGARDALFYKFVNRAAEYAKPGMGRVLAEGLANAIPAGLQKGATLDSVISEFVTGAGLGLRSKDAPQRDLKADVAKAGKYVKDEYKKAFFGLPANAVAGIEGGGGKPKQKYIQNNDTFNGVPLSEYHRKLSDSTVEVNRDALDTLRDSDGPMSVNDLLTEEGRKRLPIIAASKTKVVYDPNYLKGGYSFLQKKADGTVEPNIVIGPSVNSTEAIRHEAQHLEGQLLGRGEKPNREQNAYKRYIETGTPIFAGAVEKAGLKLPDNWVKEGEYYGPKDAGKPPVKPESVEPWNISKENFVSNTPDGYVYDSKSRAEANVHSNPGKITVGDKFFNLTPDGRRDVINHELSHKLESSLSKEQWLKAMEFADTTVPLRIGELGKNDVNTPFGRKDNNGNIEGAGLGERITDIYKDIMSGEDDFVKKNYPEAREFVINLAKENGLPVPKLEAPKDIAEPILSAGDSAPDAAKAAVDLVSNMRKHDDKVKVLGADPIPVEEDSPFDGGVSVSAKDGVNTWFEVMKLKDSDRQVFKMNAVFTNDGAEVEPGKVFGSNLNDFLTTAQKSNALIVGGGGSTSFDGYRMAELAAKRYKDSNGDRGQLYFIENPGKPDKPTPVIGPKGSDADVARIGRIVEPPTDKGYRLRKSDLGKYQEVDDKIMTLMGENLTPQVKPAAEPPVVGKEAQVPPVVDPGSDGERTEPNLERPTVDTPTRAENPRQTWLHPLKRAKQSYLEWVNEYQQAENMSDFLKDNKIEVDKILDPRNAIRGKQSSVGMASRMLYDGTFRVDKDGNIHNTGEGLASILRDYDSRPSKKTSRAEKQKSMDKLDTFLQDRRNVLDLAGKTNSEGKPLVSDMRLNQSKFRIEKLARENPEEYKRLVDISERLYDFKDRVLHSLVDSGMMTQESFDKITLDNQHHVPFERVMIGDDDAMASGKPRAVPKKVIFKFKGSDKEVSNTVESTIKRVYQIVDAAQSNMVNRSFANMADILPEMVEKVKVPYEGIKVSAKEIAKGIEGDVDSADINDVTIFRKRKADLKENEIIAYENGVATKYKLHPDLYRVVKASTPISSSLLGKFVKVLESGKSMLQVGATSTPEFAINNAWRDQFGAWTNTNFGFKPFIDPLRAISDIMGRSDLYQEYLAAGGGMESYGGLDRSSLKRAVNHISGNKNLLSKMNPITHLKEFSSLLETATRLGVYKAARRSGMKARESALESKESTLNFQRAGTQAKKVNKVIAFFNAGIQGVDKMARAYKRDPKMFTLKAIAAITIPEIINQVLNSNDEEFINSPRWRKDMFWHIPGSTVWIPKPFAIGQVFGSIPGRFMEYAIKKDKHAFDGIVNTILEATSPVGMDAVGNLLPTMIRPLVENMMNYSFFTQTHLVPEYKSKLLPEDRYSKYTSETFKELGKLSHVSPAALENIYSSTTGSLGKYAVKGADFLVRSMRGEKKGSRPLEWNDIPIVSGWAKRSSITIPESLNQFYRAYEEIDRAATQLRYYKKEGMKQEAKEFEKEHPEIKYRAEFVAIRKKMNDYAKQIDKIASSKMRDDVKRSRIDFLERKRLAESKRILEKFSGSTSTIEFPDVMKKMIGR